MPSLHKIFLPNFLDFLRNRSTFIGLHNEYIGCLVCTKYFLTTFIAFLCNRSTIEWPQYTEVKTTVVQGKSATIVEIAYLLAD